MNDLALQVRFTGDSSGLRNEVKLTKASLEDLNRSTADGKAAADESRQSTEAYAKALREQYEQLGNATSAHKSLTDAATKTADSHKKAADAADKSKEAHENLSGSLFKGVTAAELVTRAFDKAVEIFHEMIAVTEAAQASHARLEAVLRATGDASGEAAARMEGLVEAMARTTQFDQTALRDGAATIATFGRVSEEARERILKLAADMAATGRGDIQTWVTVLSKAGTEPAEAIGLVERSFGKLDPQLKVAIANAAYYNDKLQAQTLLFDEVNRRVGGTAVDSYRGLTRQVEGTKKAWEELLKVVGNEIFSAKSREASVFESAMNHMADTFKSRVQAMKDVADNVPDFMLVMMGLPPKVMRDAARAGAAKEAAMTPMERNLRAAIAAGKSYDGDTTMLENQLRGELAKQAHDALQVDPWKSEPGFAAPLSHSLITDEQLNQLSAQRLAQQQQEITQEYALRQQAVQRLLQLEEYRHEQGLESESVYFARVAQLGQQNEQDEIARIRAQISVTRQQLNLAGGEETLATARKNPDDIANAKSKVMALNSQLLLQERDLAAAEAKYGDAEKKRANDQVKADVDQMAGVAALNTQFSETDLSLAQETAQLQAQLDLVGKTDEQVALLNNQHKLAVEMAAEELKIRGQIAAFEFDTKTTGKDHTDEIQTLLDRLGALPKKYKDVADSQAGIIKNTYGLRDQIAVWNQLADAGSKFFSDLVMNGRSAFDRLRDTLKGFVSDMLAIFAKRWILQIAAGATGSGALAAQASQVGQGTITGAASNMLGSALGSGSGGLTGLISGAGTGIGGAFGTGVLTGAGDFVGTGLAGMAGNVALAAGATDAFAATVAAAVPVIGWIVAIGAILYGIFGGKGGAAKYGGSATGTFNSAGELIGSNPAAVGTQNGRFYTPNQDDANMQTVANSAGSSFYTTLGQLGGTSSGASFSFGYDTDAGGSAGARTSTQVSGPNGQVYYQNVNASADKDHISDAIALEVERSVLAALQHSDFADTALKGIFNSVDVANATKDQIDTVMKLAAAYKQLDDVIKGMDASPVEAIVNQIKALDQSVTTAQGGLNAALSTHDNSQILSAEQTLYNAVVNRYNTEIGMVRQLEQAISALKQQAYEFSVNIAQRINAVGGSRDIGAIALSHAGDLRATIGAGSTTPLTDQLTNVQSYVGAIDTWYEARKSQIEQDVQAQAAAAQAASQAEQAMYQARVQAAQTELQIVQQWQQLADSLTKQIDAMRLGGANPASAAERLQMAQSDADAAQARYTGASGAGRVTAASDYANALQTELGLLGEVQQRPSPEYQAVYNDIISRLTSVRDEAQAQGDRAEDLQAQLVALQQQANSIGQASFDTQGAMDAAMSGLNEEAQGYYTWAEREGTRLYNLQQQSLTDQLNAITGGSDPELFIAEKEKEAVELLKQIRDGINNAYSTNGSPTNGNTPSGGTTTGNPGGGATDDTGGNLALHPKSTTVQLVINDRVLGEVLVPVIRDQVTGPLATQIKRAVSTA